MADRNIANRNDAVRRRIVTAAVTGLLCAVLVGIGVWVGHGRWTMPFVTIGLALLFSLSFVSGQVAVVVLLALSALGQGTDPQALVFLLEDREIRYSFFAGGGFPILIHAVVPAGIVLLLWHMVLRPLALREAPLRGNRLKYPLLLLLVCALAGLPFSPSVKWTSFRLMMFATNVLIYSFFVFEIGSAVKLRRMLWAFVLLGSVHALLVLLSYLLPHSTRVGWPITEKLYVQIILPGGVYEDARRTVLRIPTFLAEFHLTTLMMVLHLAAAFALLLIEKQLWRRVLLFSVAFLMLFVATGTGARGGFVGLCAMCAFTVLVQRRLRKRVIVIVPAFLCVLMLMGAIQGRVRGALGAGGRSRLLMETNVKHRDPVFVPGTAIPSTRILIWRAGFAALARTKGLGIGTGNYMLAPETSHQHPHSIPFSFLIDYGFVGAVAMIWMLAILSSQCWGIYRQVSSPQRAVALAVFGGLLAIAANGLVDYAYNEPFLWAYFGLAHAGMNLAGKEQDEQPEHPAGDATAGREVL